MSTRACKGSGDRVAHTIFPCLFAMTNEMYDQTASLEFQKLRIEVLELLSNTQLFYKLVELCLILLIELSCE